MRGPETIDTLREHAGENRLKLWLLIGIDRVVLTGLLALLVFAGFVTLGAVHGESLTAALRTGNALEFMFSTMIGGVITGTTLVVSIGQLVISQEEGPIGDQHRRMSDALDFRDYTQRLIDVPPPSDPATFLKLILASSERKADALADAVGTDPRTDGEGRMEAGGVESDDFAADTARLAESVRENASEVATSLDGAEFGTFGVLFAALDFNYSENLYELNRLRTEYADRLDEDGRRAFDELETALATFAAAREYVKSLYFEWALVDLTRLILYAALVALVVGGYVLLFVNRVSFPGTVLGIERLLWVVGAAFTLTLLPFLLFISYIFRIATTAKRTLAVGPLTLRESER